jgi:hypothetical protein
MGINAGAPEVRKSTETSLVSVEALILYVHVYIPVVFAVLNIRRLLYFDTLGKILITPFGIFKLFFQKPVVRIKLDIFGFVLAEIPKGTKFAPIIYGYCAHQILLE